MAEFKGVIQTLARHLKNPKELICQANRIFYSTIERKSFVTAIVGKFDIQQNGFQFVRAGHTPVLYYSHKNAQSHFLQPTGLGIGLESGAIFDSITEMQKVQLQPGDFLVLFTDGLTEARNKADDEFGDERLQTLANTCDGLSATQIKERILDEVMEFIGKNPCMMISRSSWLNSMERRKFDRIGNSSTNGFVQSRFIFILRLVL